MTGLPAFLQDILHHATSTPPQTGFRLAGLDIALWPAEQGHVRWLQAYLQPLAIESPVEEIDEDSWKIGNYFDMDLVMEASKSLHGGHADWIDVWTGRTIVRRIVPADGLVLDFDPEEGFLCCYDLDRKQITQVTSAHTTSTVHELGRLIRDLYLAHMRANGWDLFHAGAFRAGGKTYMVPGDSGAGKTSLVVAMVKSGADFIANDRVLIKCNDTGVELRPYPMAAAIGLGTAQQYPELKALILEPWELQYPRRRYHHPAVAATAEANWTSLSDKLQLFPHELSSRLNVSSGISAGGRVDALIFPRLNQFQLSEFRPVSRDYGEKTLSNSLILGNDDITAPWRPLPWNHDYQPRHHKAIDKLLRLPLMEFSFYAARNRMQEIRSYSAHLQAAMDNLFWQTGRPHHHTEPGEAIP